LSIANESVVLSPAITAQNTYIKLLVKKMRQL